MIRLGIIFGGRSSEHEISLMSATSVIKALNKEKFIPVTIGITKKGEWLLYNGAVENIETGKWEADGVPLNISALKEHIDFALPILHGPYGEDGTIQGMFEMLDIPYAGCGVTGSALAMDKALAKDVFAKHGLPICPYMLVFAEDLKEGQGVKAAIKTIEKTLTYPLFVKPANMGSSVGITKAATKDALEEALAEAVKYDRRILIEEGIDCRELETGVIGNFKTEAAAVGEILSSEEFYSYRAKYFDGGQSRLCVPAQITNEKSEEIREIAIKAYRALDCNGFARVDFFIDKKTDKVIINEINTIPGFTKFSMFPLLWKEAGLEYPSLIERIVEYGYERYNAKNNR